MLQQEEDADEYHQAERPRDVRLHLFLYLGGDMAIRTEVLGLRLFPAELDVLKALAEREARSPASWVRIRVRQEAERAGMTVPAQPPRANAAQRAVQHDRG